jgi:hypothetical protein
MEYFWALIVGIVSSLLATALFIGISELVRRVLIPWYSDKVYRGVRIDGNWELHILEGQSIQLQTPEQMIFQLIQRGDRITGEYSYQIEQAAAAHYRVVGVLRDRHFIATLEPKSNRLIDPAVCLFYVEHLEGSLGLTGKIVAPGDRGAIGPGSDLSFRRIAD